MRWDNPLYPDWFEFPDLASFPDYKNEHRNTDDYDVKMINEMIIKNDFSSFIYEIQKFTGNVPWINKLKNSFNHVTHYRPHSKPDPRTDCGKLLNENGLYITQISFDDFDVDSIVNDLLSHPDWNPQPGTYDRGQFLSGEHLIKVQDKFLKAGIIEGVSEYSNKKRKISNVFLHVSMPTDKHYKQFFMDATTTPRWTNLHIDPKEDVIKAIVYLNDVGEDNGGFGYVPTSNRFRYSPSDEVMGRAITTGNYCKTPGERKSIFALPKPLRVSYNFGRCIMDDSELAREFDNRFLRVTSDMGNVMIFDAGAGCHQGGLVKEGKRISLQVLMK